MHDSTLECRPSLSPSQIADLRLAGIADERAKRRASLRPRMTLKYCGGAPYWPKPFLVGDARPALVSGRETHRVHLSCAQSAFSGRKRWEDQPPAGGRSASSTRRCACATRPDVPHELNLHAPDSPSGLGRRSESRAIARALALAQYHGRGLESDGLSVAQGGQGQAPKEAQRDRRDLR